MEPARGGGRDSTRTPSETEGDSDSKPNADLNCDYADDADLFDVGRCGRPISWSFGCGLFGCLVVWLSIAVRGSALFNHQNVAPGPKSQDLGSEQIRSHPTNRSASPLSGFRSRVSAVKRAHGRRGHRWGQKRRDSDTPPLTPRTSAVANPVSSRPSCAVTVGCST